MGLIRMTEKRFVYYEHKGADYILDNPNKSLDFIEMLGDCLEAEEIVDLLNCLNDENEQLKKENYELHKRLGDFEQFEEHIKERTSKTSVKECVYFDSVLGVCDIDGSVDCSCENYEELVRWIDD